VWSSALGGG